ncbi:MAG: TonB-dependent receptor family protein [Paludibacteraceae bacterium]|nr:TonB-dependent receptor family protein [Paludibacteraceae bacterium]
MVNRTSVVLFLLFSTLTLWAENSITGKVIDANSRQPIDFANVSVVKESDSIPITGVTTDEDGSFYISSLKNGNYVVNISFMGYKDQRKTVKLQGATVDLGKILLREDSRALEEVEVVAQGSNMRFELDKKVYTIDQNMANAGASVTDALANIPTIDVNEQEGTISLRNSEDVEIWINGKPAGLTADNRADILKMMPAESIKEIEIITNPSAKYSPEGTAGIINLVTNKNRKAGYYGSVSLDLRYALAKPWNVPPGGRLGFNINFNKGIVDGYFSVGYNRGFGNGSSNSDRYNFTRDALGDTIDIARLKKEGNNHHNHGGMFLRAGLDFRVTDRSTIGISGFGMLNVNPDKDKTNGWFSNNNNSPAHYWEYDVDELTFVGTQDEGNQEQLINEYERNQKGGGYSPGGNAMIDWRFEINDHHYFQTSAQYNQWNWNNNQIYEQKNYDVSSGSVAETLYDEQENKNKDQYLQLKADYEWKPTQASRLEAGWQTSLAWRNTYANAWSGQGQNPNQQKKLYFNDFTNNEQTHALYITYGNRFWDKFAVQVGLRGEYFKRHLSSDYYTANHADSLTTAMRDTSYFQVFPSVYLSYDFGNGHEIQLNYTRRIDRPRGHQINPRKDISDVTNIFYGNPNLMPQYSSALELNYLKTWEMHTLSVEAFYRFTNDVSQRVSYMANNEDATGQVMYTTFTNLGKRHAAGLEIAAKDRFLQDKIQLNTSISGYYNRLDEATYTPILNGTTLPDVILPMKNTFVFTASLTAQFLFTKTFSGQIRGRYSSPRVVAQGRSSHHYNIDLGLRKTFLDRKLALSLNVRDILNSHSRKNITETEGVFWQISENRWGSREVSLTVSYNFGNTQANKSNRRQLGGDNDMGGGYEDMSEY